MEDVLEEQELKPVEVPQTVKTLAIFAYIGNVFWGLILVMVLVWALAAADSFERTFQLQVLDPAGLIVGVLVVLGICIVPIFGAAMMAKGKKSGFWMYLIANGLWVIINFMAQTPQNIGVGAISLGFIIGFGSQLKNLR